MIYNKKMKTKTRGCLLSGLKANGSLWGKSLIKDFKSAHQKRVSRAQSQTSSQDSSYDTYILFPPKERQKYLFKSISFTFFSIVDSFEYQSEEQWNDKLECTYVWFFIAPIL